MLVYTSLVQRALEDMTRSVGALSHIDPRRVLVIAAPRISPGATGNLAQCYALHEFQADTFTYWYHPRTRRVVRVTPWARHENTRVTFHGAEMRYIILLRLPRLLMHNPIETIIHELIHIGPNCDGRLRRLRHGHRFNALTRQSMNQWLLKGNPELVAPLQLDYPALTQKWGSLVAWSFKPAFVTPRVQRLENQPPLDAHPDFKRKNLSYDLANLEIREKKWTPADVPATLTERDLIYRVYTPASARPISAAAVHLGAKFPAYLPGTALHAPQES